MAKTASASAEKFARNAAAASQDYVKGASETSKDQAAEAIKGAGNYNTGVQAAIARGAFAKGLQKAGKGKWLKGVQEKGAQRFAEGAAAGASSYATESARFDTARNAAASLPRGPKGSAANLSRVSSVVNALRAVKTS